MRLAGLKRAEKDMEVKAHVASKEGGAHEGSLESHPVPLLHERNRRPGAAEGVGGRGTNAQMTVAQASTKLSF